jgi:hypothetical protein
MFHQVMKLVGSTWENFDFKLLGSKKATSFPTKMWLPCNNIYNCNISLQPNSPRLFLLCSWITKCSKPSSNSGFETDYIKSLFGPIPPDFCFYVPESQNAPNHHLLLLLQILVLGMTTKNLSPTKFLQTFVCVFLNHKMLQIFFICFYFVGPHIEQRWKCSEAFTFITFKSSSLFWGQGRSELSTFQESLATCYSSPPPHPPPNRALSGACFACLLAHNSAVHELANEPSH